MNKGISLVGIHHSFGDHQVLHDINLHIEKGEIIGLLGPSGAGKTTLVNIMTGQLKPSGGDIYLDGDKTESYRMDLSRVGVMMDNWGLYERLSVYDNLKFYARIFQVPTSKIEPLLAGTGLGDAGRRLVSNLSKGMRSRVNLCRALLKDISVLFLDEPTSGLDPATTRDIHEMILAQKERGTTIFLTTHNMFEAQSLCDHVALLNQGKIVEYGTPAEICKRYNHLHRIEIERKNGEKVSLSHDKSCIGELTALLEAEDISTIHSTEPDLEKVFLELTGRRFE